MNALKSGQFLQAVPVANTERYLSDELRQYIDANGGEEFLRALAVIAFSDSLEPDFEHSSHKRALRLRKRALG